MTKNKANTRTVRRTLSLLLALVMLLGVFPQITLPVHALGGVSGGTIDEIEYEINWSDDTWGEGNVAICCPGCETWYDTDFSQGDSVTDVIDDLINDNLLECRLHCFGCFMLAHCSDCAECMDDNDSWCPECESRLCIDCHDDSCFCDICGCCRIEASTFEILGYHINSLPNIEYLCTECLEDQEYCANCNATLSFAAYYICDEMGLDWCESCQLCHKCYEEPGVLQDFGHCVNCGVCGNEKDVCDNCHLCETCNPSVTHCPVCDTCCGEGEDLAWCADGGEHCPSCCEENGWLCTQCGQCTQALGLEFCDECELCEECCALNIEKQGCIHDYCICSSDYEDHLCPACSHCPEDMECEYCGMCESCQEDYHCRHGICPENDNEWEEHLCESCGDCFELDELCEFCHMCRGCQEHCEHDFCPEDPEYDDHFCEQCGDCYDESEFCDECELCVNCCEENTLLMGCNHGLCVESSEFQEHYCFEDCQCLEECDHDAGCTHQHISTVWKKNGTSHWHECEDCGASVGSEAHAAGEPVIIEQPNPMTGKNGKAKVSCSICGEYMETVSILCIEIPKDGKPYILSQPKDYKGKVSDVVVNDIPRCATYRVTAGGEGLKYQWYRRVNGVNPTKLEDMTGDEYWYNISGMEEIHGATTNELTVFVFGTSCYDLYEYWCVVTNKYGSVTTRYAKQDAQHVFGYYCNNGDGTHSNCCFGDGCGEVKGRPAAHRYTEWELKQAATATQQGLRQQTCMDCGHTNKSVIPAVEPDHIHSYTKLKRSETKHWYECACGKARNEQPHSFGEWNTVRLPTVEEEGRRERKCSVCGYTEVEQIAKLSHVHDFESLKKRDPNRLEFEQYYILPNGYVTEDAHVRYCARCTATQEEPHAYSYWRVLKAPYTDDSGVFHPGILSRYCETCGRRDQKSYEAKWPVLTEVHNDTLGYGGGGPATVGGTPAANPGEKVTVTAVPFDGYYLDNTGETGSWGVHEVSPTEGMKINGKWYGYKNGDVKDFKVNTDGSLTFTMPDGPVALILFPGKCDHKGYGTTPDTIPATCTGYGSKVERCRHCGGVVNTTDILEPLGHDLPDEPIPGTERVEYCSIVDGISQPSGAVHHKQNDVKYGYSGDFECRRCHQAVKGKKTPLAHGRCDRDGIAFSVGYVSVVTRVEDAVEPTCTKDGYTGDVYCHYCKARMERGEKIPRLGHDYPPGWYTVREATNRVKGLQMRECGNDPSHIETRTIDYTGPDYRIRPDKTRIHFDFTYGEQPEPQTVTFTSIGRSQATEIARVYEALGLNTTQKLDGMTMTVTAVPWEMIEAFTEENEYLQILEVNGVTLPEEDIPEIEVSANIRKTAEKYDLTVEGGKAWIDGKEKRTAKASLSVSGGEYINLAADDPETFLRWEIVEDESGYLPENWGYWTRHYEEPETDFYMSANPVKIKALTRDTPGVYQITFANNDGTEKKVTVYTNSRGQIDTLPYAWWANRVFDGWWTKPSGGVRADVGMTFTGDTTLYAHWRTKTEAQSDPFPPLRFTKDSRAAVDGSLIVDIENMAEENDALMEAYFGGDYVTQWFRNGRLISGYNYDSLQLSEADRGAQIHAVICFNGHQIVGEDVRILGRDELPPASYTVSFDAGPGHVSPSSAQTGPDGKLKALPEPWRENYAFAGWYTRGLDYEKIFVDVDTVYSKDTTLYAEWEEEEQYDLEIAGTRVTSTNRNDILGDGLFSFDGDKTLTVRGSCTARRHVIYNKGVEGLIINVAGDAAFMSANDWEPIKLEADTTITGTGTLTVTTGVTGIYMYSRTGTLTIRDANVEVSCQWGIAGPNGNNGAKLVLDNAGIKLGCVIAAVCDFGGGITMKNCQILLPRDGKISDDGSCIVDADGNDAYTLIIEATGPVTPPPPPDDFRFDDVRDESKFYFKPVYWAYGYDPQITNGIDATHFGPDRTCTRGQVVTFLWRAAGCPEPSSTNNPFNDVKSEAFYYKAVLWAVEQKITNGTGPTTFGPDQGCTRGQVVTFLWRAQGSPEPKKSSNRFTDVKAGAFYQKAVLWAVEQELTNGTSRDKFSPDATCTRGQIVTFLYRAFQAGSGGLLMYADEIYNFVELGLQIKGYIAHGSVKTGDEIKVWSTDSSGAVRQIPFTVQKLVSDGQVLRSATVGDHVGIYVGKTTEKVNRGDAVVSAKGFYQPVSECLVGKLAVQEGTAPLKSGDQLQIRFDVIDETAVLQDVKVDGGLQTGHSYEDVVLGNLSRQVTFFAGQKFDVYKDGDRIGIYEITEVK